MGSKKRIPSTIDGLNGDGTDDGMLDDLLLAVIDDKDEPVDTDDVSASVPIKNEEAPLSADVVMSMATEDDLHDKPDPDVAAVLATDNRSPVLPAKGLTIKFSKSSDLQKIINNPIDNDKLVSTVRKELSTSTILQAVMEEMAEEAAFIKAWRNENWNGEVDLSEATAKRIKMLKDLVETLVKREDLKKEKNIGKVDFYGESFQKVMKHFLEVIQRTFRKVNIPSQYEDIFFSQLAKEFDGFEKSAEKLYYGKD